MTKNLLRNEYFLPGDWRNQIHGWIKDNCADPLRFSKFSSMKSRVMECLSLDLAKKRYPAGGLWSSQVRFDIQNCGKTGECQKHKKTGETRFVGYYCNHRTIELYCAMRYRNGQGVELKNQYMEIVKAQKIKAIWSITYTLPGEVRKEIDKPDFESKNFLTDCRRAIAKTIKEYMGISCKTRNIQPGFSIFYHPVSSGNPFKQSAHFHSLNLPILVNLKTGEIKKIPYYIEHKRFKAIYKKHLDKVLLKYGLGEFIKDGYSVHLRQVKTDDPGSIEHAFKYTNRSQVADILKCIKRVSVNFKDFVCIMTDKENDILFPIQKTKQDLVDALDYVLKPLIPVRQGYGFMRMLEKYSNLLGIERDDYEDDENWEMIYIIEILRITKAGYDEGESEVKIETTLWVKPKYTEQDYEQVEQLRGEKACMSDRKLFKAKDREIKAYD